MHSKRTLTSDSLSPIELAAAASMPGGHSDAPCPHLAHGVGAAELWGGRLQASPY